MKQLLAVFCVIMFLFGCASLGSKTTQPGLLDSAYADQLVVSLKRLNSGIKTFKSIGRLTLQQGGGLMRTRAVWAGEGRDKIRIEVLGLTGRPLSSFAYDGRWIYFLAHAENRFHKKKIRNADLDRIVSIPIEVTDILAILSGRVPIMDYSTASLVQNVQKRQYILTLGKKWWKKRMAKIYLAEDMTSVLKYEFFEGENNLVYRAVMTGSKQYDGYRIPENVIISNGIDVNLQIEIQKFWPDIALSSSMFVLQSPENKR